MSTDNIQCALSVNNNQQTSNKKKKHICYLQNEYFAQKSSRYIHIRYTYTRSTGYLINNMTSI